MSNYGTAFQMACAPGPRSAAAMMPGFDGVPVLVVYLDPVNMTIQSPPSRAGVPELAKFCRELAREAQRFADTIDPAEADDGSLPMGPRHALPDDEARGSR